MDRNIELISVVVPIYKVEKYLNDCVQSLLRQTYKNLEIILVDDGSPDNCGTMVDEYAEKHDNIIAVHKTNGGLSSARNEGLKHARGEYIAFVDSDDIVDQLYIEKLLEIIKDNECEIAVCRFDKFEEEEPESSNIKGQITYFDKDRAFVEMFKNDSIGWNAWNKLYKIELFKGIEYPVGMICEDKATTYKLILASNKIGYTQSVLYHYRIRKTSISGQHSRQFSLDSIKINNIIEDDFDCQLNPVLKNNAVAYSAKCAFMLYANALHNDYIDVMEACIKELQEKYKYVTKADFISTPIKTVVLISGISARHRRLFLNTISRLLYAYYNIKTAIRKL